MLRLIQILTFKVDLVKLKPDAAQPRANSKYGNKSITSVASCRNIAQDTQDCATILKSNTTLHTNLTLFNLI